MKKEIKKGFISVLSMALLLASCKPKQAVVAQTDVTTPAETVTVDADKPAREIATAHYANPHNFSTLLIKADARYEDKNQTQNVSADIRMKKDETILVSVRYLGFTVAKALITPSEVSYYEKLNGTFFKGDYKLLSRWLGTDLDFKKVQNLLLGEAIYDLNKGKYTATADNGQYKLTGKDGNLLKQFLFEGSKYLLIQQQVDQNGLDPRSLTIQYPAYNQYSQASLPASVGILAEQADKVKIDINYNSVTFDEKLTFPFEIPENSKEITIE